MDLVAKNSCDRGDVDISSKKLMLIDINNRQIIMQFDHNIMQITKIMTIGWYNIKTTFSCFLNTCWRNGMFIINN